MKNINAQEFKSLVIESKDTVVIDFWAEWCGPCKRFAPIFEEVTSNRTDIKAYKVNVDENRDLAMEHGVRNIPTLLFFKNGEKAETIIGALEKEDFEKVIGEVLSK